MVTILDDDGEELATCVELFEGPRGLLVTRVLSGKGRLLTHYFARVRAASSWSSACFGCPAF